MLKRDELAEMTFEEIKQLYGEQAAIDAGIAADPDTFELETSGSNERDRREKSIPDCLKNRLPDSGAGLVGPVAWCDHEVVGFKIVRVRCCLNIERTVEMGINRRDAQVVESPCADVEIRVMSDSFDGVGDDDGVGGDVGAGWGDALSGECFA